MVSLRRPCVDGRTGGRGKERGGEGRNSYHLYAGSTLHCTRSHALREAGEEERKRESRGCCCFYTSIYPPISLRIYVACPTPFILRYIVCLVLSEERAKQIYPDTPNGEYTLYISSSLFALYFPRLPTCHVTKG